MDKAIITASSNKYFPTLVNLLASLHAVMPNHPPVFVYDLGLLPNFRKELESIQWVKVISMPKFCSFWRSCYTWKTYIFTHPLARLNFYLDAGCQILQPIDEIFEIIDSQDYFATNQDTSLYKIVPEEYKILFPLPEDSFEKNIVAAGIFGFKENSAVSKTLEQMYAAAVSGLTLGFSQAEQWRNRGIDKSNIIRNCLLFRHDTTLLSIFLYKNIANLKLHQIQKYGGYWSPHDHPEQLIWNLRRSYSHLDYLDPKILHGKNVPVVARLNRLVLWFIMLGKNINQFVKRSPRKK